MPVDYSTAKYHSRRSPVFSTSGVAASSQSLASEAGIRILHAGGNAADAGVAMAAMLNVTEPCNCGIGGDVFALFYNAKTGKVNALNGSGRSPKALTLAKARELGIEGFSMKPSNVNSATVAGSAAAWVDIHETWGSGNLTMQELLQPAIDTAKKGFPVGAQAAAEWLGSERLLAGASPASKRDFLIDGKAPRAGEIFQNPGLAATLEAVAKEGKAGFYEGRIAKAIVDVVTSLGGVMTLDDLKSHTSTFVEPVSYTFGKEQVTYHTCPPNGQGLAAAIALGIIDVLQEDGVVDLDAFEEGSAEWLHTLIGSILLSNPVDELLSKDYLRSRAKLFNPNKATPVYEQGQPLGDLGSSDTVYFTAADSEGNALSMIMSNFAGFGTGVAPEGCGFTLQNRGSGFYLTDEPLPNRLEGGKRPYHTIIPGMVTKAQGKELFCSYGIMGGRQQPQAHVQVLLNLLHRSHHPQSALDAPRFCVGGPYPSPQGTGAEAWYNKKVCIEEGISEEAFEKLKAMGHDVERVIGAERILFGKGQMIKQETDKRTGLRVYVAGSDPRGDGVALPSL